MRPRRIIVPFLLASSVWAASVPWTAPQTLVERYAALVQQQGIRLRGASMEVEIEARLPKLKKEGRLHALRHISRLGRITYDALRFDGDNTVKSNVIAHYLTADTQSATNEGPSIAVTPANYKFRYRGLVNRGGRDVHVFS